jgi:small subunit ribosomal protein S2
LSVVSMKELLEAGVHFGHQTKRWDPRMKPFIFTQRKGIHILDLQKTVEYIDKAYNYVKDSVSKGASVLFVGTKKQSQEAIEKEAVRCEMPYVSYRWLGGMLTNYATIARSKAKLEEYEGILENPDKDKIYTKKELQRVLKLRNKLNKVLGGIRKLNKLPDILFVIDPNTEATAVNEARKLKIPVVAVVDTNCNPTVIDYPIPGNDDAIRAVNLFASVIANAVMNGKKDLQLTKEGVDESTSPQDLSKVAYVSKIDKASDEDIGERTFSPDDGELNEEIKKEEAEAAKATAETAASAAAPAADENEADVK